MTDELTADNKYYLVDPNLKLITPGETDTLGWQWMRLILSCRFVQSIHLGGGIDLWVDEECLINDSPERNKFWVLNGAYPSLLCGYGVVCGVNEEGESTSLPAEFDVEPLRKSIIWLDDAASAEAAIQAGIVPRPQTTMQAGDKPPEVLWEWRGTDQ